MRMKAVHNEVPSTPVDWATHSRAKRSNSTHYVSLCACPGQHCHSLFMCQDDNENETENRSFRFVLDIACDERTKPLVKRYMELLVRS